ncbi:MAG: glutamate racemase [Verrucomicrobia bacterium]|nr:glutamate racemase [Verrucomicrobiota bacterium]
MSASVLTSVRNPVSPDTARAQHHARLRPIGVFDSGIGGLTVVSALHRLLPSENIFYLGDTARVPYGGKSAATIERYSLEISGLLLAEGAKAIVVACNTASALALGRLQETLRVPVVGVIAPGARAAIEATRNGRVGVIGTKATIASGAYERALRQLAPDLQITAQACPLLVPLIEEGLLEDALTEQHVARYLEPMLGAGIDTLILGCTHYPLLKTALARRAGPAVHLVDSAHNCALAVQRLLAESALAAPDENSGLLRVALTDASDSFLRVAERALGLDVGDVELRSVQGVHSAV